MEEVCIWITVGGSKKMSHLSKLGLDAYAVLDALSRSQAIIEFDLTGKILKANDNFCKAVGYQQSEIVGRFHSMFLSSEDAASPEYKAFWAKLSRRIRSRPVPASGQEWRRNLD
ncbi:hypothetical protein AGR4B_Lc60569 [Agrobacterium tumefaciens str. CFBP 5621]|nr:hypothetical protein AGR4B_Lc60569 [Agrobacterium tumefaciens str. CFBP 5621]